MVAAASFADIVENRGQQQKLWLGKARINVATDGMAVAVFLNGIAVNVFEQTHGVLIHGIGVEKVKLHLADNLTPLRQVADMTPCLCISGKALNRALGCLSG